MIFTENLDHSPKTVTLEPLPDGFVWLYLRKDVREVTDKTMSDGESSGVSFECSCAMCQLSSDYSSLSEQSVSSSFDAWWTLASNWDPASGPIAGLSELAEKKVSEVNAACDEAIYAGVDVELSGGAEHFALTLKDQTNIDSMFDAVKMGAEKYLYHADSGACMMYSAADIAAIYTSAKVHITYCTTYCNALKQWIKRETDPAVLEAITYGSDLPEDLAARMQQLLAEAQEVVATISAKLPGGAL